jgi:predicted dehydrogenase
MERGNLSRRGFLAQSVGGLVAAGLPLWYARETVAHAQQAAQSPRAGGANDRIVMAAIGTGTNRTRRTGDQQLHGERGVQIMNDAMGQTGVQMVAVCDVDRPNAEFAKGVVDRRYNNTACQVFTDYRELLRNNDIQAVTIGTPDHWHAAIAIAAMEAGKDVYCEKPLTLTIDEGKAMARVARQRNRVLQTGSQQRSDARFRLACELVRNNRIGRISRVTTLIGSNPTGGPFTTTPPPEGLNWDVWLGPTARVDYCRERCHYDFRWWYDYSGGKMTDWGAHHNDIAQWGLGMDESGPVEIIPPENEKAQYGVKYVYANGVPMVHGSEYEPGKKFRGVLFLGENGFIEVDRGHIRSEPGEIIKTPLGEKDVHLYKSPGHQRDWLECIKTRKRPICDVEVGARSVTVCHLGNLAYWNRKTLKWDPKAWKFADGGDNKFLDRERRGKYQLPTV